MKLNSCVVLLFGCVLLAAGIALNPWTVALLFSPDRKIETSATWIIIFALEAFCLWLGTVFVLLKRPSDIRNALLSLKVLTAFVLIMAGIDFYQGVKLLQYQETPDKNIEVHIPDPVLGWRPKPNSLGRHISPGIFDVSYQMDQDGFKKIENSPNPDFSIYIFGDSFAFGHGIDNQHTFATVLADTFLTDKVNVFNLAVMGYGILQMYLRYLSVEERIRPGDVILFAPITPDLYRGPETEMLNRKSFIFSAKADALTTYPVYRHGAVHPVKIHSLEGYWNILTYMAPYASVLFKPFREMMEGSSLQKSSEIIQMTRMRVEAKGAKFALIFFPLMDECATGRYDYDLSGFQYYSMLEYCPKDEAAMDAYQIPEDGHPTALGHREAARSILKILLESRLVDVKYVKQAR